MPRDGAGDQRARRATTSAKSRVGKLNVDDNPALTMRYMVRGIPTVMLFKGGQIVDQLVGLADKGSLKQMVDKHL